MLYPILPLSYDGVSRKRREIREDNEYYQAGTCHSSQPFQAHIRPTSDSPVLCHYRIGTEDRQHSNLYAAHLSGEQATELANVSSLWTEMIH